jgi:CBS domain-containing protein
MEIITMPARGWGAPVGNFRHSEDLLFFFYCFKCYLTIQPTLSIMNFTPNLKSREQLQAELPRYESVLNYMVPLKSLITFRPDQNINEVIDIITEKKISGGPVLDENQKLVGIISEKDCLRIIVDQAYYNTPFDSPKVSDYMTADVKTISQDTNIVGAATEFINCSYRRLPIVHDGVLVGQVSRRDILRAARRISPTSWA